jgi:hypothetical protein
MDLKLINRIPAIDRNPSRIGEFYIEYTVNEPWDRQDEAEMGDWLANNCTKNYIYTHEVSRILGGGCYPIKSRWMRVVKQRAINRGDDMRDGTMNSWAIRLSKEDDVLFRLTWLSDL